MLLYLAITDLKIDENGQKIIYWYCPERVKPVAPYELILEGFHLCPDEPVQLTEFEKKIYYDSFTQEERELLLTDLSEESPDYISGLDLKKEEVEFLKNYRYSKDEARRCINEFFTEEEVTKLQKYLKQKYGFALELEKIQCPIDNTSFFGYCRDPWDCEDEPDYVLHGNPDFPLNIPVEGVIQTLNLIEVHLSDDGTLYFCDSE